MLKIIPKINKSQNIDKLNGFFIKKLILSGVFPQADKVFVERVEKMEGVNCEIGDHETVYWIKEDLDPEAYQLEITEDAIRIFSKGEKGYSNGLVTLFQLLSLYEYKIPCVKLTDEPRFEYRGFMLDVCRHFVPILDVKKIIEQCAILKINMFHWHLSNDQGYRIESVKFPELNRISSYRKLNENDPVVLKGLGEKDDIYGGYYTHTEIQEVIEYAAQRQITIVPEVSFPGHATAILAAKPELSCCQQPLEVGNNFGVFEHIFCGGNEGVYDFLFELLDEVCSLVPGEYIHLGGDEVPKVQWQQCKKCQAALLEANLKNNEELQAHTINKLIKFVKSKGKKAIVWNDVCASGLLDKEAIVQYWIEMASGPTYMEAELKKGRKLILSSMNHFYSDYSYAEIPLRATLMHEPEVKGIPVSKENVLGIESPMWTEWTPDMEEIEKLIYPRLAAVAECGWTHEREATEFLLRLEHFYAMAHLNVLSGMSWQEATVHGQKALDMIVKKMLELSAKYNRTTSDNGGKAEAVVPEDAEAFDPLQMIRQFIYNKMKSAYTETEIEYVTNQLIQMMSAR